MYPMIVSVDEVLRIKDIVRQVMADLTAEGIPFNPDIEQGIMIETPAAVLISDQLAELVDFFSIGTNDLTQYTLAVDRSNEHVAHLYDPLHPAVLTLIDRAVRAARRAGISISLCGEMASDPLAVPILVGLGISELSGTPSAVPVVKEIIHALDSGAVDLAARCARQAGSAVEVRGIAAARLRESGLLDHADIGAWLRPIVQEAEARASSHASPGRPRA